MLCICTASLSQAAQSCQLLTLTPAHGPKQGFKCQAVCCSCVGIAFCWYCVRRYCCAGAVAGQ